MTTVNPNNLQALFPDYPRESPLVDKDGNINPVTDLAFGGLFQALQTYFSNEGITFPSLSATNIAAIQAVYTPFIGVPLPGNLPDISGQTVFDSTNRVPKQFIITYDGSTPPNIATAAWKTFTLT